MCARRMARWLSCVRRCMGKRGGVTSSPNTEAIYRRRRFWLAIPAPQTPRPFACWQRSWKEDSGLFCVRVLMKSTKHSVVLLTMLTALHATASAASPQSISNAFSCHSGPYALRLPKLYPSLLMLGRHQAIDAESHDGDGYRVTTRWLEFDGLRLGILVFSNDANRYLVFSAEASRARWAIGSLSIGTRTGTLPKRNGVPVAPPTGIWELQGESDSATVTARNGVVERVVYSCYVG
jgi:hypothetical protein